jgi:hypothetical protein
MKMLRDALLVFAVSCCAIVYASPSIVSDPYPANSMQPTHCGFFLDSVTAGEYLDVAKDAAGLAYCKKDAAAIPSGQHVVYATGAVFNGAEKLVESESSNVLSFVVPSAPTVAPKTLRFSGAFFVSDALPATPAPTHCIWYLDALPANPVPIWKNASGALVCKAPLTAMSNGTHTMTASAAIVDKIWGTKEGPKSVPFVFGVPGSLLGPPSALRSSE